MRRFIMVMAALAVVGAGTPSALAVKDAGNSFEGRSVILPKFDIEKPVEDLAESFKKTEPLIATLDKASVELKELAEKHKKNPTPLNESLLEKKLSEYVEKIMVQIDDLVGDRDQIEWALKELRTQTDDIKVSIFKQAENLDRKAKELGSSIEDREKELAKLARRIRKEKDPEKKKVLVREFRKKLIEYRLQQSYVKGNIEMRNSYRALGNSLASLSDVFNGMGTRVMTLIDSLEQQRELLVFAVKLRADSSYLKEKITQGIAGGKYSIANINEKTKLLYTKLAMFGEVSKQLEGSLGGFASITETIKDINLGSEIPGVTPSVKDLNGFQKVIDKWAEKY